MSLRSRIEELERKDPGVITLTLDDGSTRSFPRLKPIEFLTAAENEIRSGGGPIAGAILRCVAASSNIGRLWELIQALFDPVKAHRIESPASFGKDAPIAPFERCMTEGCPNN